MNSLVVEPAPDAAGGGLLPLLVAIGLAAIYAAVHLWTRHSLLARALDIDRTRAAKATGPTPRVSLAPRRRA